MNTLLTAPVLAAALVLGGSAAGAQATPAPTDDSGTTVSLSATSDNAETRSQPGGKEGGCGVLITSDNTTISEYGSNTIYAKNLCSYDVAVKISVGGHGKVWATSECRLLPAGGKGRYGTKKFLLGVGTYMGYTYCPVKGAGM